MFFRLWVRAPLIRIIVSAILPIFVLFEISGDWRHGQAKGTSRQTGNGTPAQWRVAKLAFREGGCKKTARAQTIRGKWHGQAAKATRKIGAR